MQLDDVHVLGHQSNYGWSKFILLELSTCLFIRITEGEDA